MPRHQRSRRLAVTAATSALALASLAAPATPAQAGLLGDLTGTVTGTLTTTVSATTDLLASTVDSLLGPTGWIVDDGVTDLDHVAAVIGADRMYSRGYTGRGVGVALVDTGVVPVAGMTSGNVVNGPDLSFESQSDEHRYLDTFGHGTHMAGIIAGNDSPSLLGLGRFQGIAPGARLTSVKVASAEGAVDVSQVVAAVDWVVQHRNDDPANPIRVLSLSYGTDGVQDYRTDPLTHAVENAWRAGIVVVVSGGNSGTDNPKLNNPAYDPYVLAVGASDTAGTVAASDDVVPSFSSRGDASRRVDLVAPGRSIKSLRVPGSYLDEAHPNARVEDRFFKGSGSSQAAAVVSGAVALLLQSRPGLRPDQVKALLRSSAEAMPRADAAGRGSRRAGRLPGLPVGDPQHQPDLDPLHRPGLARAGPGHPARRRRRDRADRREARPRQLQRQEVGPGQLGLLRLDRRQLGRERLDRDLLVRRVLDRQVVVGQVVVRSHLDRQVVVGQVVVGQVVVG